MKLFQKNKKKASSLRRRMVFYFLLVAIANVFVGMEILWEIKSQKYRAVVVQEVQKIQEKKKPVEHVFTLLDKLAQKFVIMIGILIVVSAVVLFLFVVQIASPIQYMIDKARLIADGDLSVTIEIKSQDELADLGKLINDLTANLQEIIAQLEQVYRQLMHSVEDFEIKISRYPEFANKFSPERERLQSCLEDLNLLKESFTLFRVQALAEEPEQKKTRLGQLLLQDGVITEEQLERALEVQKQDKTVLGAALMKEGLIDADTLRKYMEKQRELEEQA
ncbi:MAG: HAMP domain-containing protein [Candidatus Hydrogenedentota bacterium]|nr:MAG: HAMP domain-containing protein [Candidatus Hydrogenedentota bacterium]